LFKGTLRAVPDRWCGCAGRREVEMGEAVDVEGGRGGEVGEAPDLEEDQ
jgi:hypothetical protein